MRKYQKDHILGLIDTMNEAHNEINENILCHEYSSASNMLIDCQQAAIAIGTIIEEQEGKEIPVITDLELYCEYIYQLNQSLMDHMKCEQYFNSLIKLLEQINFRIQNEIKVKFEIVFLPYKSSMWDSLESIWIAVKEDTDCDCYVIPIPYYERNPDKSFGTLQYEGDSFPDYVPITHYEQYDFEARKPDVIYIHNPYDQHNYVTSVHPYFYSKELKKKTGLLVYVPYYIAGAYKDIDAFKSKQMTTGAAYSDLIIAQSEVHKDLFISSGINPDNLLVLGSPKADAMININERKVCVPDTWETKICENKVIVFNSSIGSLLSDPNYLKKLDQRLSSVLSVKGISLIWRPHPLLEATIKSMRPKLYEEYQNIYRKVHEHKEAIIDTTSDVYASTIVSDGLISDISSWIRQYIITKKPILVLNGKSEMREKRISVFDHFSCYFINDGFSIKKFCEMILNGNDVKVEERIHYMNKSIINLDGSSGSKIHDSIKNIITRVS